MTDPEEPSAEDVGLIRYAVRILKVHTQGGQQIQSTSLPIFGGQQVVSKEKMLKLRNC